MTLRGTISGSIHKTRRFIRKSAFRLIHPHEYRALSRNIFVTYTMGKVGSMTIERALNDRIFYQRSYHIHFLTPPGLRKHQEFNSTSEGYHLAAHFEKARKDNPEKRLKVITLVRDPLARDISDLFQNYEIYLPEQSSGAIVVQKMLDFFNGFDHAYGLSWMEEELGTYLELNVYDHPFDREKGFSIIREKAFDLLIIRLEDLSRVFAAAMHEFTGVGDWHLPPEVNNADSKFYASVYADFKKRVVISDELIHLLYDSPFFRHFYREEDKIKFVKKWKQTS
jgi:hypothetical protein